MEAPLDIREQMLHTEETTAFDPFYVEFKLADDLPLWLKLQHEIRAKLEKLVAEKDRSPAADFGAGLQAVNDRIAAYNNHVPNAYLRKPPMTAANWLEEYEGWQ
ncbi:MAG: hypothetical protein K0R28_5257 [Paenibacillus sp.]|jgi:hypothetical protein|nr:hypothetical protein [Paenibacillus sp.]